MLQLLADLYILCLDKYTVYGTGFHGSSWLTDAK
jgi:hypothetical protein